MIYCKSPYRSKQDQNQFEKRVPHYFFCPPFSTMPLMRQEARTVKDLILSAHAFWEMHAGFQWAGDWITSQKREPVLSENKRCLHHFAPPRFLLRVLKGYRYSLRMCFEEVMFSCTVTAWLGGPDVWFLFAVPPNHGSIGMDLPWQGKICPHQRLL